MARKKVEAKSADPVPDNPLARWKREIQLAKKHFAAWEARGDKVVSRYRDDRNDGGEETITLGNAQRRFNILWSNVQTLMPAMYSRPPKVQVSRRFNDADPVARCASIMIERAVDVELEKYDIGAVVRPAVEDRLLPGRGTAWVRYEVKSKAVPTRVALQVSQDGGYQLDGQPYTGEVEQRDGLAFGTGAPQEEIDHQCTPADYVHWKDFLCSPARLWEEVRWVARKVYMGREALVKRFGDEIGNAVQLNAKPPGLEKDDPAGAAMSCAEVWELWDKASRKVYWINEAFDKFLDEKPDPLNLAAFFPTPKPLCATLTTGSLIPVPDFCQYQDQAQELDDLTNRIALLTKALKVVGVYNSTYESLKQLLDEGVDNTMIPVDAWGAFGEKGGLKGAVDFLPIEQVIAVLLRLYEARAQVKQDLYEVTGIGDVIRGSSDPNETATAQGIKAKYAGLRLTEHQADVERFARDLIRLKAEIMCEKYEPQALVVMSGILQTPEGAWPEQPPPAEGQPPEPPPPQPDPANPETWPPQIHEALKLLKSPLFRDFRIDIETRSMAQMDEEGDRQQAMGFLESVGGFMSQAQGMVQQSPPTAELAGELLLFAVRKWRVGRELESVFDRAIQAMKAQPPSIPPEVQKQMEEKQAELEQREQAIAGQEEAAKDAAAKAEKESMALDFDRKLLAKDQQIAALQGSVLDIRAGQAQQTIAEAEQSMVASAEASEKADADATKPDKVGALIEGLQQVVAVTAQNGAQASEALMASAQASMATAEAMNRVAQGLEAEVETELLLDPMTKQATGSRSRRVKK